MALLQVGAEALGTPAIASMHPAVNRWVIPGWFSNGASAGVTPLAADTLYYQPIFVADTHTYAAIGIRVLAAVAAASTRLGVFNWASGLPGSLVQDCGTVASATTGNKTITVSIPITGPNFYFLAYISDQAITVQGLDAAGQAMVSPVGGIAASVQGALFKVLLTVTGQTGVVADGFPPIAVTPTAAESADDRVAVRLQE